VRETYNAGGTYEPKELLGAGATALKNDRRNDHYQYAGSDPDDHASIHKPSSFPSI
jgi:hypothetical protein